MWRWPFPERLRSLDPQAVAEYAVGMLLTAHAFVVFYEEPTFEQQFGESYEEYLGTCHAGCNASIIIHNRTCSPRTPSSGVAPIRLAIKQAQHSSSPRRSTRLRARFRVVGRTTASVPTQSNSRLYIVAK